MARANIRSLTGLRGIAALWVAMLHGYGMLPVDPGFPQFVKNAIQCGWVAVDLFFVLSGYIICYVHLDEFRTPSWSTTWHFWKLRLARIYPAHLVMTVAWVPVLLLAIIVLPATVTPSVREQYSLPALISALTLTNGWGLSHSQGWNGVSWSVGSEWFAYLTFPILTFLLNKISTTKMALLLAMMALLVPFALAFIVNGGRQYMLPWSWTVVRVETAFILGSAMYLFNRRRTRSSGVTTLLVASVIGVVIIVGRGAPGLEIGLLIGCFAALIASLGESPRIGEVIFGSRLLVFLGQISYSIYLSHYLVVIVLRHVWRRVGSPLESFLLLVVYLGIVVMVGYCLFRGVEDPARRFLRRAWVDRERESAISGAGVP
jgi:peptidoglycan/LPS O-acetylase OafA/YrhL